MLEKLPTTVLVEPLSRGEGIAAVSSDERAARAGLPYVFEDGIRRIRRPSFGAVE